MYQYTLRFLGFEYFSSAKAATTFDGLVDWPIANVGEMSVLAFVEKICMCWDGVTGRIWLLLQVIGRFPLKQGGKNFRKMFKIVN